MMRLFAANTAPPPSCQTATVPHHSTVKRTTPCSITAHGHSLSPSPQAHKLHTYAALAHPGASWVRARHVLTHRFCVCGVAVPECALCDVEDGSVGIHCTATTSTLPHTAHSNHQFLASKCTTPWQHTIIASFPRLALYNITSFNTMRLLITLTILTCAMTSHHRSIDAPRILYQR